MKKQIPTMKLVEYSTYTILVIISIISFFMSLFKFSIPLYICSTLCILLSIFLIIHLPVKYEIDIIGILLIIFGGFIVLTQIIFLFAYNDMVWAQKFLWYAFYIIIEIIALVCNSFSTSSLGVFNDVYILNACVSFLLLIYFFLYNLYTKDYEIAE